MQTHTVQSVLKALADLDDPKIRAVNERHGDDHGVNLTKLRSLAKEIRKRQDLARDLWKTESTAAQLVAVLIAKPREFSDNELDAMLREARSPKVREWFVNYIVNKSPHCEALRLKWLADEDSHVASSGWELTATRAAKDAENLDLAGFLDTIEREMKDAPDALQWAMNNTLAQIGINHEEYRPRALDIGERLGVLRDYPTSPGCTSPFAPIWINEMVSRHAS